MRIYAMLCLILLIGCRPRPTAIVPATAPTPTTAPTSTTAPAQPSAVVEADSQELVRLLLDEIAADPGGVPREVYEQFWSLSPAVQRELLGALTKKSHPVYIAALLNPVRSPLAAMPGLVSMLDDPDPLVARAAAEILDMMFQCRVNARLARVEEVLNDPRYQVATDRLPPAAGERPTRLGEVATVFAFMERRQGVRVPVSLPDLVAAASSPNSGIRLAALRELVAAGPAAHGDAAAALARAANDSDAAVRAAVPELAASLQQYADEGWPAPVSMPTPDMEAAVRSANASARAAVLEKLCADFRAAHPTPAGKAPETAAENSSPQRAELVAALSKAVDDPEPEIRVLVVELLTRLKLDARDAVPMLARLLNDNDSVVRLASIRALKSLGSAAEPAIPGLIARLQMDLPGYASIAADALVAIGKPAAAPLFEAFAGAKVSDVRDREKLLDVILRLGADGRGVIPVLAKVIRDRDDPLREKALETLLRIGLDDPAAGESLGAIVADTDDALRARAADILLGHEPAALTAMPQLKIVLKRPGDELRPNAIRILEALGPRARSAAPDLVALLNDRSDSLARLEAARAIGVIDPEGSEAIPALLAMLREGTFTDGSIPDAAARALVQMGPRVKDQLPILTKMLASPKSADQRRALEVIESIGADARPVLPALATATADPNAAIHQRATLLLLRLQPDGDAADAAVLEAVRRHDYMTISLRARDATRRRGAALRAALADLAAHSPDARVSADARIALADLRAAE